jgi:methionyl aminopeptidase
MEAACAIARDVLAAGGAQLRAGGTTADINAFIHAAVVQCGAYPAPLNYMGFPRSVCASVNEVVVHGIPDMRVLQAGDVVSLDLVVFYRGMYGDTCRTFVVPPEGSAGEAALSGLQYVDDETADLVRTTHRAMHVGIDMARAGTRVGDLGTAVGDFAAAAEYESVRDFAGHGIGKAMHSVPLVIHAPNREPFVLSPHMAITVEPMLVEGRAELVMWQDGWTVATMDRGLAAQFEHCVYINEKGAPTIMTAWEGPAHTEQPWLPGVGEDLGFSMSASKWASATSRRGQSPMRS